MLTFYQRKSNSHMMYESVSQNLPALCSADTVVSHSDQRSDMTIWQRHPVGLCMRQKFREVAEHWSLLEMEQLE